MLVGKVACILEGGGEDCEGSSSGSYYVINFESEVSTFLGSVLQFAFDINWWMRQKKLSALYYILIHVPEVIKKKTFRVLSLPADDCVIMQITNIKMWNLLTSFEWEK